MDLTNRHHQTLGCRTCRPVPPSERRDAQKEAARAKAAVMPFVCEMCGQEKLRQDFWPLDFTNRHRQTLGCKTCKPIPPSERRKQGQAPSSSSAPGPSNAS
eukprot:5537193-Karenia_brevis.AAC.1